MKSFEMPLELPIPHHLGFARDLTMNGSRDTQSEQTALWNGAAGRAWVDAQDVLDRLFSPFKDLLVEAVRAASARSVLDVGCGTGSTTIAIARSLEGTGSCLGVDISEPMITLARARNDRERAPAAFVIADAQVHAFAPASVDMIVSRFGVMFFSDPVQAFANLRRAAREGAQLRLIAWRSAAENPFMTTAERAAAPMLPDLPRRRPDGPGQFAFADRDHVHAILNHSGWSGIDIRPIDVDCSLLEQDLPRYVTRLGPVGLLLQDADDDTRARVAESVRSAYDPYVHGDEVRFTAACWMINASLRLRSA
jgi:SAM-dependent methyltransferase